MKRQEMKNPRKYKGLIYETGEPCIMEINGAWAVCGGHTITSYIRIDKPDNKQYSRNKNNIFFVETVD